MSQKNLSSSVARSAESQRAQTAVLGDALTLPPIRVRGLKPRFRGFPDLVAAAIAVPAGAILIANATVSAAAATGYGIALVLLFAVSATYHTPFWPAHIRKVWRRIDHASIFVLMSASYAPVCLGVLDPAVGMPLLTFILITNGLGVAKCFFWEDSPRWLNTTLYLVLGWTMLPWVPELYAAMSWDTLGGLFLGGVLYSLGAAIYSKRWPNPNPAVFGYHEVFHLFVIAAAGCHYYSMWQILVP